MAPLVQGRSPGETRKRCCRTEEADVLRILFRIVTIVSFVKLISSFINRRRGGGDPGR